MGTLLTASEVAARLRVRARVVYGLVHAGQLEAVRVGRLVRIPEAALAAFVARGGRPVVVAEHAA